MNIFNAESKRGTGRTTRMIEAALKTQREGKKAIIICSVNFREKFRKLLAERKEENIKGLKTYCNIDIYCNMNTYVIELDKIEGYDCIQTKIFIDHQFIENMKDLTFHKLRYLYPKWVEFDKEQLFIWGSINCS